MRVALKSVNGVDSVDVSLNKGLATVTLKPGNTVTMQQLQQAIAKNGFTTKQATVLVIGTLDAEGEKSSLRVLGSGERYDLQATPQVQSVDAHRFTGKTVAVDGVLPEAPKGQTSHTIQFSSIKEQ